MSAVRMADLPTTGTDVLVVGAGPTGLMAGLVLTRRGVPVVVVDQKEGPTRESRALAVQARTMEIYDQLGLADQVLAGAYPALRMQIGTDAPLGGSASPICSRAKPGSLASRSSSRALMSNSCPAHWRRRALMCSGGTGSST
jgi:2-polyprenyl-6-methoxyphenol hydroxylase-like FAD-dependent oxidoreductase